MRSFSYRNLPYRAFVPWLGLACILCVYVGTVAWIHPTNLFGLAQDDTIYFSSAKALAQGQGYVLPGLPGTPPATKYPVLFPWMLSFIWRWNPSFPSNLVAAIGLVGAFGCAFLVGAFLLLRDCLGLRAGEALGLVAFCGLHPVFLLYSGSIFSDVPFAALAVSAMIVANRALRSDGRLAGCMLTGALAGLSILVRAIGLPIAIGFLLFAGAKRAWRQAAAYAGAIAPFIIAVLWRSFAETPHLPNLAPYPPGPGWVQTWAYYTNYPAFRQMASPSIHSAGTFVLNQALYFIASVPRYFLSPLFDRSISLWFVTTIVVFAITTAGVIHQAKKMGWQPAHAALAVYIVAILSWDYPEAERFLIPFFPLVVAGFWFESKTTIARSWNSVRAARKITDRVVFGGSACALVVVLVCIVWNFGWGDRRDLKRLSSQRGVLLEEKQEAYEWLRGNSRRDARVVASEDGCLYLYTGRTAMAPVALLPSGAYDSGRLNFDLAHIMDVAQGIGADYWLASPDDSDKQWTAAKQPLARRFAEVEAVLPEVFRSRDGRVRIYGLGCVQHPEMPECRAADAVLFPRRAAGVAQQGSP